MSTNFPTGLQTFTPNPTATDKLSSPSHSTLHANLGDTVYALQQKVGITNSADTSSLDYKVNHTSSVPFIVVANDGKGDYNCDGTNDEVEIQAAIDAIASTGGEVFIKRGTYNLYNTVYIDNSNIMLTGEGEATILKRSTSAASNCHLIRLNHNAVSSSDTITGITIRDITIDGNQANSSSTAGENILMDYVDKSKFVHLTSKNATGTDLWLSFSQKNIIEGNIFAGSKNGYCIRMYSGDGSATNCDYNIINGNVFDTTSTYSAIVANEVIGLVITNNVIKSSAENGIEISQGNPGTSPGSFYNVVSNNVLNGTGITSAGSALGSPFYSIITNNVINSPISVGISVAGGILSSVNVTYAIVANNIIRASSGKGMYINTTAYALVTNNYISECQQDGISALTAIHCKISDNYLFNNGQATNNSYSDIWLGDCTHNHISNNKSLANAANKVAYAFREVGTADYNYINDNCYVGAASGGVGTLGTHTVISNNQNL